MPGPEVPSLGIEPIRRTGRRRERGRWGVKCLVNLISREGPEEGWGHSTGAGDCRLQYEYLGLFSIYRNM